MKQFIIYLAKGIAIAIFVALVLSYVLWSLQSGERIFWCITVAILSVISVKSLSEFDWKLCKDSNGKIVRRPMTKFEKVGAVFQQLIGFGILGTLVWLIGLGAGSLFNLEPAFGELYFVYGLLSIMAVSLVLVIIGAGCEYFHDLATNATIRRRTLQKFGKFLMWMVIIICSLATFSAILYYLIPLLIDCEAILQ